ncbi:SDR family NAD(P)-dependent oxidoreductase [Paenibacillus sp. GCM10027626]|uniref:SDR family NAD(P)-dependent oxidoreductase n=1 Tax=Paenibacillus sp. GCM10027626 TaxID=3273411 RepID=UPI0036402C25
MSNRVVLVTGASRGIGLAIANKFSSLGYRVLAPSREELDLMSNSSIDAFVKSVTNVDVIVNNAGINLLSGILELQDIDLNNTMETNLFGPLRLIQGIIPYMIKKRYGRIVNISSIWGGVSKERRVSYSISKSALNGMTRAIAVEVAQYNILVNSLAPGFVNTELTKKNNTEEELKQLSDSIPIRRLAEPIEIAEVAGFLGSENNSYITGQTIFVDGGFTCI